MSFKKLKPPLESDSVLLVQPVSVSEDELSSPECLLLQPVGDDYSSDDEARKKEKKNETENSRIDNQSSSSPMIKKENEKDSSKLSKTIITNSIRPLYVTHGFDFTQSENLDLAECIEELLDFALEENTERRTLIDDKKLFDGKTSNELIQFWLQWDPKVKWIYDNFKDDIGTECIVPEDILKNIKGTGVQKEWESMKESKDIHLQAQCLEFVNAFLEIFATVRKYDAQSGPDSSPDELHDIFKQVVPLVANFFDISSKGNGQCKVKLRIFEVFERESCLFEKDHLVITKPDLVLRSDDDALTFPVEVYAPIAGPDKKGSGIHRDLDISQIDRSNQKFETQHMLQHVGLLIKKMVRITAGNKPMDIDDQHVSVGMFLTRGVIHFSKVNTSVRHLSSFTKNLQDLQPADSTLMSKAMDENWNPDEYRQAWLKLMLNKVKKDGFLVSKSRWHIDLYKSLHRNALFIFLLHYFLGYRLFVQNKVKIQTPAI